MSWHLNHTAVFRAPFEIKDPSKVKALRLRQWAFRQEDIQVFINGELVAKITPSGSGGKEIEVPLSEDAIKLLRRGRNTLAATYKNTWRWGRYFARSETETSSSVYNCGVHLLLDMQETQPASKTPPNPKKLKIVFLMGQSNMVGYASPETAWYLTQPMYIPPRDVALAKPRYYDGGSFYWQGVAYAHGPEEFNAMGKALLDERRASRTLWRRRAYENLSSSAKENNWLEEWGPAPQLGTKTMYPFLDKKAEEEGIYRRMAEHIESPENTFHPKVAYEEISGRDAEIAGDIKRVRDIFLRGTRPEDFDRLEEALSTEKPADRAAYAELVKKHVHLPIARRTHITAFGEIAGEETEFDYSNHTQGPLSVGYGKMAQKIGPEYAFGITFEQLVEGPVLIVKCSWGGTSVHSNWRPPSLSNFETPIERATRQAAGRDRQTGTGPCLQRTLAHIRSVLADLGKYHPDYDPDEGYELTGLVWFQGYNDMGNPAYGQQLAAFIKDFRKEVEQPRLPVVCGLLGGNSWKNTTFDGNVNSGMLYAASDPSLKGTVDIVNTVKYNPIELNFCNAVKAAYREGSAEYKKAEEIRSRAISNMGFHYHGSAKFFLLTGDAMARSLANLVKGGEPTVHKEAETILQQAQ